MSSDDPYLLCGTGDHPHQTSFGTTGIMQVNGRHVRHSTRLMVAPVRT